MVDVAGALLDYEADGGDLKTSGKIPFLQPEDEPSGRSLLSKFVTSLFC